MSKLETQFIGRLALVGMLGFAMLYAKPYKVDTKQTKVSFEIRNLIFSSVEGTFKSYTGKYNYNNKTKHLKSLEGTAKVSSIFTDNEKRDTHLQSEDILNAKKFPTVDFKLIKHDGNKALITLTIKGISKEWTFKVTTLDTKDNKSTHIKLKGKISREAYGININAFMEAGGVMIGDEIKINLDIVGK